MLDNNDGINLSDDSEVASFRTLVFSFADHLIYYFFLLRTCCFVWPDWSQ